MEAGTATDRELRRDRTGALPAWLLGLVPLLLIVAALGTFAALGGPGLSERRGAQHPPRHHDTSKNPCQPSSVNSDWWAWNMNRPVRGKRSSRIPRWPWHCMTVSVSSTGSSDVPVGK